MVRLVLVQVPLAVGDAMNQLAALVLLKAEPFLAVLDASQRNALALLFLRINGQGAIASELESLVS